MKTLTRQGNTSKTLTRPLSVLLLATLLLGLLTFGPKVPRAAASVCLVSTTADGRPIVPPSGAGAGTGKTIGFDNTHGETAGAADWVINGGFSDMACALAAQGYTVEEIRAYPLTQAILGAYQAVVLPEPNIPLTTAEEQALQDYVASGGGLLLVGDHYQSDRNLNTWDSGEVFNGFRRGHFGATYATPSYNYNGFSTTSPYTFNQGNDWLAGAFGFRFRYNAFDMVDAANHPMHLGDGTDPEDPGILPAEQTLGVTSGVNAVATYAGATMSIVDPSKAMGVVYPNKGSLKIWSNAQSDDPVAMYTDNVGTPAGGSATYGGVNEGAYVVIAKPSAGKVAAVGDSSLWEDSSPKYRREDNGGVKTTHDGWTDKDHAQLGINLVNWLTTADSGVGIPASLQQQATQEPYSSFTIAEPIVEPWSAPPAGYLWYDSRTFKANSYGGPVAAVESWNWNPLPLHTYPGNKLALYLDAQGLTANSTISDLAYLYVTGNGQQISRRYNRSTGTFADPLAAQNVTTDAAGRLQRWEFFAFTSSADRGLSARVKVGKNTKLTKSLTQVDSGSFGYLTIESSLGYSDGLHAALFGVGSTLDTSVWIANGEDTTVTLPAGSYLLSIRSDSDTQVADLPITITAGQTVSLASLADTTPPVITADRTPANENGWNNSDVTVTFTCSDSGSGIASCTSPVTLSAEGADQSVTGTAVDNNQNAASLTVSGINIDKTAPEVAFSGGGTYDLDQTVSISCTATDALSGVAGDPCGAALADAPAYTYAAGEHTLQVTARDLAGNETSAAVTFTVQATFDGLSHLTEELVTKQGVAHSLVVKLQAAAAAAARGDDAAKAGAIAAYQHELDAQKGKAVTPENAALLQGWAAQL